MIIPKILLIGMALLAAGCSGMRHIEWTEETTLSDNRIVHMQRTAEFRHVVDAGAGFQAGWLYQSTTLSVQVPPPNGGAFRWDSSLTPIAFDFVPGDSYYLVCYLTRPESEKRWTYPRGQQQGAFRWTDGEWKSIPMSQLPDTVQVNVLGAFYYMTEGFRLTTPHVDASERSRRLSDTHNEAVIHIVLEDLKRDERQRLISTLNGGQRTEWAEAFKQPEAALPYWGTYRVTNGYTYPRGLYNKRAALFIIPKGVAVPRGDPGDSTVYDLNTRTCSGPRCR